MLECLIRFREWEFFNQAFDTMQLCKVDSFLAVKRLS